MLQFPHKSKLISCDMLHGPNKLWVRPRRLVWKTSISHRANETAFESELYTGIKRSNRTQIGSRCHTIRIFHVYLCTAEQRFYIVVGSYIVTPQGRCTSWLNTRESIGKGSFQNSEVGV